MESRYIKTGLTVVAVVSVTVVLLYIVIFSSAASLAGRAAFPDLIDVEHNKTQAVEIKVNEVIINITIGDKPSYSLCRLHLYQ